MILPHFIIGYALKATYIFCIHVVEMVYNGLYNYTYFCNFIFNEVTW